MAPKARVLFPLLLVFLVVLVVIVDARRRQAEAQLKQLSVRLEQVQGGPQQNAANQEMAREVVQKVKGHMNIDTTVEPTVATIVDITKLRERNPFYNNAENGDFLIVTQTRAILYDPDQDIILDVVPVQIEQPATTEEAGQ